jgi:hypothetical protein
MKKNKFFDPQRFWLLMRNDLMINYKKYLLTIAGALIVGFFVLFANMPKSHHNGEFSPNEYIKISIFFLFALGAFTGLAFPDLSNKTTARNYMMLPGSHFEKYLQQFTLRGIGGIILFFIIYWTDAQLARTVVLNLYHDPEGEIIIKPFRISMLFVSEESSFMRYALYSVLFAIGTYMFAIRLFFKRLSLVKTLISLIAMIYIIVGLVMILTRIFYPEYGGYEMHVDHYRIWGSIDNFDIWIVLLYNMAWMVLLPLGYFKLKEKQL